MTGFVVANHDVWGRPVGVAVGEDGSLFVSEDATIPSGACLILGRRPDTGTTP